MLIGRLIIGSFNINTLCPTEHGVPSRVPKVKQLIEDNELDILVLCETKLHEKHEPYDLAIKDFDYVRFDRVCTNASGGLLVYFRKGFVTAVIPPCDHPGRHSNSDCQCDQGQGHCDCHRHQYPDTNVQYLHIEITSPIRFHLVAIYSP